MPKVPPPRTLLELTVEALYSRQKRVDWEWVICAHIRKWEQLTAEEFKKEGRPLLHGHFAWHHWHEICDRVLARARVELQRRKKLLFDLSQGRKDAEHYEFGRRMCHDMVYPECWVEFRALARALKEHGLPLCAEKGSV